MTREEILAKIGLDSEPFARGIRAARQEISDFAEKGHSGFVHAGNGAREFHRVLHQITESSPILGTALKAALSPVGALITAIGLGFKFFSEILKEMATEAREFETLFARPLVNAHKASADAAKALADLNREYEKWVSSHHTEDEKIATALEDRIRDLKTEEQVQQSILKHKKEMGEIGQVTFEKETRAIQLRRLEGERKALEGGRGMNQSLLSEAVRDRMAQFRTMEGSNVPREISLSGQSIAETQKLIEAQKKKATELGVRPENFMEFIAEPMRWLKLITKYGKELPKELDNVVETTRNLEKSLTNQTEQQEKLTSTWKDQQAALKEAESIEKERRTIDKNYTKALKDNAAALQAQRSAPLPSLAPDDRDRGSLQELAQSRWFGQRATWLKPTWNQGIYAEQAQAIQQLERAAHDATINPNLYEQGFANRSRARADLLRAQLEKAGALKKDSSEFVEQIYEHLVNPDKGVVVKPVLTE